MTLSVCLLGHPEVRRDGHAAPAPRGHKVWALLAYLVLAEHPVSRRELAELLFEDADDPVRALRWNLTELRKLLGAEALLTGDPVRLSLPPGSFVDVMAMQSGTWAEALSIAGLGQELLAGTSFRAAPAFEAWHLHARRHLAALSDKLLGEAVAALLAAGQPDRAVEAARRLVAIDPLDEQAQALLIRSYVAAGWVTAARQQLAACRELFDRELGIAPGPAVSAALRPPAPDRVSRPHTTMTEISTLIQMGQSAIRVGAVDAGLVWLHRARGEAILLGNDELAAEAVLVEGSALVHAGRGRYAEGQALLHRAVVLADRLGNAAFTATAYRDLAWVDMMAGRYEHADGWLAKADDAAPAGGEPAVAASLATTRGWALSEVGDFTASLGCLAQAVDLAQRAGADGLLACSLALQGRIHLLRFDLGAARTALEAARDIALRGDWAAYSAMTGKYLGSLELAEGHATRAAQQLEASLALAQHLRDPCLEAATGRGVGLLTALRGDTDGAVRILHEAWLRPIRENDHRWSGAWALDALCTVAVAGHLPQARRWVHDLQTVASRTGMQDLLVRAWAHRSRLGDEAAAESGALLAAGIDNPHLQDLLGAGATDLAAAI